MILNSYLKESTEIVLPLGESGIGLVIYLNFYVVYY